MYVCDENVFVMSPCCGGCQILDGSRMQPLIWRGCQILASSRMHAKNMQVTIGVAYVSVTCIK
jgi:hypothetical protein